MPRLLILAVVAFVGAQISGAARASTIDYNYTLTLSIPTLGSIGGWGSLDFMAQPNGSGSYDLHELLGFD